MVGEATAAQKLELVKAQVAQMNAMIAEEKPLGRRAHEGGELRGFKIMTQYICSICIGKGLLWVGGKVLYNKAYIYILQYISDQYII